ncbi:acyltransferase family protein [Paraburkholderia caledonica]|uniref:acyltransferase family protein n=1 Tax=Paraburkholderia caledonica TaxID=134536 RepID=UPI0004844A40|nr:acyltransferase [Paraburkholderia caledonica]
MSATAIHPAFPVIIIGLLACGFATVIARHSRFYRALVDEEILAKRFHSIDGLRGYLALGVVFHHVMINYQYYQSGVWELTPSRLNTFLGHGSVAFFFMITAYLFWNRATSEHGHVDAFIFYVSRLRRMVPMYLFCVTLLICTVTALTHFRLMVSTRDLAQQILSWILFTVPGAPDINGFRQSYLVNTVFWSLVYEWKFYLMFPLLAIFARPRTQWFFAAVAALCIWFYSDTKLEWFFLSGCLAAMLTRTRIARVVATGWVWAAFAIACAAAALLLQPIVYSAIGAGLLLPTFVVIASGNSMFGLLTWRPARLLGLLSYSVYLLHNQVLYLLSRLVNHYVSLAAMSKPAYYLVGTLVVLLTIAIAALTYRLIEYPFLRVSPRHKSRGTSANRERTA